MEKGERRDRFVPNTPAHIYSPVDVAVAMNDVIISLLPALLAATIFFGLNAIYLSIVCISVAVITELVMRRLLNRPFSLWDRSAVVTGLLLALTLPPTTSWWLAALGAFVAIAVAKELFGGIGRNIFNPALFGRVFIFVVPSWKIVLDNYVRPMWWKGPGFFSIITSRLKDGGVTIMTLAGQYLDGLTGATPLAIERAGAAAAVQGVRYLDLFLGNIRGSLGETSALALLAGAAYLLYRGHINWRIPGSIIGTVAVVAVLWGQNPVFHILAGGLILGAFFMATDWVTSPVSAKGQIIYGVAIGLFIMLVRRFGLKTEGVALAILHMNPLVLFIDRYTLPRPFGG
ncbi:MAG: RnfABCDGE type electron transport complex subunit D [bacterium]